MGCPELEYSKTASFCDFFLKGRKETKLLNFECSFIYIQRIQKNFFKVEKTL